MQRINTAHAFRSLQAYWRHRAHRRLQEETRNRTTPLKLGGGGGGNPQSGRIRPKGVVIRRRVLRLRALRALCSAPVRALAWMRDVYVDAMLAFAGGVRPAALSRARSGGAVQGRPWARRVPRARQMSARAGEFEKRMMAHIYNAIVNGEAHGEMAVSCKEQ